MNKHEQYLEDLAHHLEDLAHLVVNLVQRETVNTMLLAELADLIPNYVISDTDKRVRSLLTTLFAGNRTFGKTQLVDKICTNVIATLTSIEEKLEASKK